MSNPQVFECNTQINRPLDEVWDYFSDPRNLEFLTPPFLHFKILNPTSTTQSNQVIDYQISLYGFRMRWKTLIADWQPKMRFVDLQLRGPYRLWRHTHTFQPNAKGTAMHDRVEFELPFGRLGQWIAGKWVKKTVERIFLYRSQQILLWSEQKSSNSSA